MHPVESYSLVDERTEFFLDKIRKRKLVVGVLGLGYVGLPLIVAFAEAGFSTLGFDLNEATVQNLNTGISHIRDVASEKVQQLVSAQTLNVTSDFSRLRECDVAIICVPTPLSDTRDPNLDAVKSAVSAISTTLQEGQLVVLESTTYPGTTDEIVRPLLEEKLKAGQDFFLAFSPERIDPGNSKFPIHKVPKVVGGHTSQCLKVARALYDCIVERTVAVSSTQAAELTKLLENIFRSVNIALVNEMALLCDKMKIDIWEVIDAASTKPYGFMPFSPGPGLGGHCIPVDPFYLSWKAREYDFQTHFIELAGEINRAMPYHVVDKILYALNDVGKPLKNTSVALLGMSYKANIGDCRESPSLKIAELLIERGARLSYNDPYVESVEINGHSFTSAPITEVTNADCVVLLTNHSDYDYTDIASSASLIVDTRNAFKGVTSPSAHIVKL